MGTHCASTFPMKYKLPKGNTKQASSLQLQHIPSKHSSVQGCLSVSNLPQTVKYVNYKSSIKLQSKKRHYFGSPQQSINSATECNWQKTYLRSKIKCNHLWSFLLKSLKRAAKLPLLVVCKHKYSPHPRTSNTKCSTDPVPGLLELRRPAWAWGEIMGVPTASNYRFVKHWTVP